MKFLFIIITSYLHNILSQPCAIPKYLISQSISGSCPNTIHGKNTNIFSSDYLGNMDQMNEFTIASWFKITQQGPGYQLQPIFMLTSDESDQTANTSLGVRAALFFSADTTTNTFVQIQYSTQTSAQYALTSQHNFPYLQNRWIWAAISISYTKGFINYYAIQPTLPNVFLAQSVNVGKNFNIPLTNANTYLIALYWGQYKQFCGLIWIPYYFEMDVKHNWMNMMFLTNQKDSGDFKILAYYKMEDQVGQVVKNYIDSSQNGFLGSTLGIDSQDPQFNSSGFVQLQSFQYITLYPITWMTDTNMVGVSLWFKSNATIFSDCILVRRVYQGSSDVFVLMVNQGQNGQNYTVKIKINNNIYRIDQLALTKNKWHFISVRLAYPLCIRELTIIMYDVIIDEQSQPHSITNQADEFKQSSNDLLTIGDSQNSFLDDTLNIAHVQFFQWYVSYVSYVNQSGVNCQQGCNTALQSISRSICQQCKQNYSLQFPGLMCGTKCIYGDSGINSSIIPVCQTCNPECSSCLLSGCYSCSLGYYLNSIQKSCVLANYCQGNSVADYEKQTCTLCGNGIINTNEQCDDGNFISGDGCTNCQINSGYSCNNTIGQNSICKPLCGNGQIDSSNNELCDDGNNLPFDGCYKCQIENSFYCTGQPSVCMLLCGNGYRTQGEQCDDGNFVVGDGCSPLCKIESGYVCVNGSPTQKDNCTRLCGNGQLDNNEDCDDGNNMKGDGCYNCQIEFGWECIGLQCTPKCGDGLIEQQEQCDDGNTIKNDGCTECKVDVDYNCTSGSAFNKSVCVLIPAVCGDGYKSTSEQCEDGNQKNGDGCSSLCIVEEGWQCVQGDEIFSIQTCSSICGDVIVVGNEQCDQGILNGIPGSQCNSQCQNLSQLAICGDRIRQSIEQCDDGNQIDGDGCSDHCIIEIGWGCNSIIGSRMDQCFKCTYQCSSCTNQTIQGCFSCYNGFVQNQISQQCQPGCPIAYFHDEGICRICSAGCSECLGPLSTLCTKCMNDYYFFNGECLHTCDEGYYNQVNAIYGNICQQCISPCQICSSAIECIQCSNGYYVTGQNTCQSCNMGSQCLQCNFEKNLCLGCELGYRPRDNGCYLIPNACQDGMRSLQEQCDDGNNMNGDGCNVYCVIEQGWNCVVNQNSADSCYQLIPLQYHTYIDEVHFDTLYLLFDRPLRKYQQFNFSNLIQIVIAENNNYTYNFSQQSQQLISIVFSFDETVNQFEASMQFPYPNQIVDRYNWTLVGLQNDTSSKTLTLASQTAIINYFIYYSRDEQQFAYILGYLILGFGLIAVFMSMNYTMNNGSGKQWKIVELLQFIGMLRFIHLRYSLHLQVVFQRLNYFSLTFIPIIFQGSSPSDIQSQMPPSFQIDRYEALFLLNAGGRFISVLIYIATVHIMLQLTVRFVKVEKIQARVHEVLEFFEYQIYLRLFEVIFLDLMVSLMINLKLHPYDSNQLYYGGFAFAIIILVLYFILHGIFVYYIVLKDATQIFWLHSKLNCIYDGFNIRYLLGKIYIMLTYIQKFMIAVILVTINGAVSQIIGLVCVRLLIFLPALKLNPYTNKLLLIREFCIEVLNCTVILATLMFSDPLSPKQIKLQAGWIVSMIIVVNTLHWNAWNFILQFYQKDFKPPDYFADEKQEDLEEKQTKNNQQKQQDYQDYLKNNKLKRKQALRRELEDEQIIEAQQKNNQVEQNVNQDIKEIDEFFGDMIKS